MSTNIALPESLRLVAPRPAADATATHRTQSVAVAATTVTAAQDTGWTGDAGGCFVTFQADVDMKIAFGSTTGLTAPTAADFVLHPGVDKDFWIEANTRYFKAFGGAGAGTLKWVRSS